MRCPACGYHDSKVVDSRQFDDNTCIRRRRECLDCSYRFTTYERTESAPIVVIKADGSSEEFNREKLFRGMLIACAKRPVSPEQINSIIDSIENKIRSMPKNEIKSKDVGELALKELAVLDDVAYVRFASVYKEFKSIEEFSEELERLRK